MATDEEKRKYAGGTDDDHTFRPSASCAQACEAQHEEGTYPYAISTCGKGRSAVQHRLWHVVIYELGQGYGGPEEGGWYYEYGEVRHDFTLRADQYYEARMVAEALGAVYTDKRQRYSVVPRETDYEVRVQRDPGRDWPARRPHYE